ncbi:MAG TPA: LamG domain-containing protein, partial [Asanoa sp.]|nr:LamG domain-containing protein [Asanoa sp.]
MPSTELRHKPVVGYCDPMAVAPGEPIRFMVSTSAPRFTAMLVRLRHGDPHPDGPGLRYEPVPSAVDGDYPGSDQPLHQGSAVVVDDGLDPAGGFTVQAWIYPTTPDRGLQGLLTRWDGGTRQGFGLFVEPEGDLSLRLDEQVYRTGVPLRAFEWSFAAASYDPGSGVVTVTHTPLPALPGNETRTANAESVAPPTPTGVPVMLGGQVAGGRAVGRFNGKLSAPRAYDRALEPPELAALAAGTDPTTLPGLVAAWNLVGDADSELVPNLAGAGLTGRAVNQPMTGVTGHNWSGDELVFHRAPAEYNAMFFHEDDLDDA